MWLAFGAMIMVATVIFIVYAFWHGKLRGLRQTGQLVFAGVAVGVVVANLPGLSGLVLDLGEKGVYRLRVDRAVGQVERDKKAVQEDKKAIEEMKIRIEALAVQVKEQEQNVSQMYGSMQQTWRAMFESFAYVVGTSSITPVPTFLHREIDRHLNIIATFAYPDPKERANAWQQVLGKIQEAHQGRDN